MQGLKEGLTAMRLEQSARAWERKSGLLVASVGNEKLPILMSVVHWKPGRVCLAHSAQTKAVAEKIRDVVAEISGRQTSVDLVQIDPFDLTWPTKLCDQFRKDSLKDSIILDATGGMKTFSIALDRCARDRIEGGDDAISCVYFDGESRRFMALAGPAAKGEAGSCVDLDPTVRFSWRDFASWKGYQLSRMPTNDGWEQHVLDAVVAGGPHEAARGDVMTIQKTKPIANGRTLRVAEAPLGEAGRAWMARAVELGFAVRDKDGFRFNSAEAVKCLKGGYLERLLEMGLKNAVGRTGHEPLVFDIGQIHKAPGGDEFEVDGVYSYRNRLIFVSCTAGSPAEARRRAKSVAQQAQTVGGRRAGCALIYDNRFLGRDQRTQLAKVCDDLHVFLQADPDVIYDAARLGEWLLTCAELARPVADV